MTATQEVTHEYLLEHFSYSPETGHLKWIKRPKGGNKARLGDEPVGCINNVTGYLSVGIKRKRYYVHRVIWFYVHGEWPKNMIDHINGIRADNRLENLRDVPRHINTQNVKKAQKDNLKTGLLGVVDDSKVNKKNPYSAKIKVNSKSIHLGYFSTPQQAHDAYVVAKRKYHEGCAI